MADTKWEDEEEWFGDFKLASFPNQAGQLNQINGRKPNADNDDDDWGDFMESPLRSEFSSGLAQAQSPPNPLEPSKPFDPFGFFSDPSTKPPESMPPPTQSAPSPYHSDNVQWVKPKGALPLSIFGVAEEEEDEQEENSVVLGPSGCGVKGSSADKNAGNFRNGSNMFTGSTINDVIANLYNQNQQINAGSRSHTSPNREAANPGGEVSKTNGLRLSPSGLDPNSDLFSEKLGSQIQPAKTENGVNANLNWLSMNLNETHLSPSGNGSYMDGLISVPIALSPSKDFFAGNGDNQSQQAKTESVLSPSSGQLDSTVDLFASNGGSQISEAKSGSGLFTDSSGLNLSWGFFPGNRHFDTNKNFNRQSHTEAENGLNAVANVSNSNISTSALEVPGFNSSFDGFILNSNPAGGLEKIDGDGDGDGDDGDEDGWEFKDAFSETKNGHGDEKVHQTVQENLDPIVSSSGFSSGSYEFIDVYSAPNGLSGKTNEVDARFDFKFTVVQNAFSSDLRMENKQNGTKLGFSSDSLVVSSDSDETFGEFTGAFPGTQSKQEGLEDTNEGLIFYIKPEETVIKPLNLKEALPLSIFGDEELETNNGLNGQDVLVFNASYKKNGIHGQGSNISIDDLLSNLYHQSEQISSVSKKPDENGVNPIDSVPCPCLTKDDDDDFDDASWEFKDASCQMRVEDQTSLYSENANENISPKVKPGNFVEFYSKLKEELCFVCGSHLDNLKKAQSIAALSGEDAKVAALEEEIQEASEELHKVNVIPGYVHLEDKSPGDNCLSQFAEVLHEVKFQVLESEYQLSRRLQLAEKDLRIAVEVMKHATSMLNILTLGSIEEQSMYVSMWSKMISACAEELRHGSQIWKQSLERNVHNQIISEPQGMRYVLSLGEIYRVAVILGASAKLYKPWMLVSSADSTSIYATLEECYALWSGSELEEALQSMSDPIDFEYHSSVKSLVESSKHIQELDALALEDYLPIQQDHMCQLSALPSGAIPDIKLVSWNGNNYFLTLANLWANLVSAEPPSLPLLRVGR